MLIHVNVTHRNIINKLKCFSGACDGLHSKSGIHNLNNVMIDPSSDDHIRKLSIYKSSLVTTNVFLFGSILGSSGCIPEICQLNPSKPHVGIQIKGRRSFNVVANSDLFLKSYYRKSCFSCTYDAAVTHVPD